MRFQAVLFAVAVFFAASTHAAPVKPDVGAGTTNVNTGNNLAGTGTTTDTSGLTDNPPTADVLGGTPLGGKTALPAANTLEQTVGSVLPKRAQVIPPSTVQEANSVASESKNDLTQTAGGVTNGSIGQLTP
ncbi:hypothetical protein EC973_006631 [Apophysomyces ossiformis]|uniref:Uncharacterized protein n=1 Tax=Apophysomyces ossiformis TaxID=679940 RepID=A0A8H7BQV7_9FUNG|nr:hypothetical protein EC973_006631 [Apophysomyces ossiformis]